MSSSSIDIQPLFQEFRSDQSLEKVIRRAKAVLAVDESFFDSQGTNARNPITAPNEGARLFVDQSLTEDEGNTLTFNDCFEAYCSFCRERKIPAVSKNQFKSAVSPHITRRFNRGIRHDPQRFEADKAMGWRGIRLVNP